MGFNLMIGEAEVSWDEDRVRIVARGERHDDAPAFGEPTDFTNARWPSCSGWTEFAEAVGMRELFFGTKQSKWEVELSSGVFVRTLIAEHPGASPVTKVIRDYINAKYDDYVARHPGHLAQYPPPLPSAKPIGGSGDHYYQEDLDPDPKYDGQLCRFQWLRYWVNWAVDNCKHPVFTNS